MTTITAHDAKTHLSRYLAEVEQGKEYFIACGKKAVSNRAEFCAWKFTRSALTCYTRP